jgi:preprotein translocase subunit SecG
MPAIPKFVVLSEQLRGQTFELNQDEITIGRSDERTICLKDPTVSTLHCKVTRTAGGFAIADAGSTNGTKVNGKPLDGEYELQSGDTVKVGAFELLYDTEDKTMTMSIQKTQTGIDINAASTTQTIKSVANSGFIERKQSSGLSNNLMIIIVILGVLLFVAILGLFVMGFKEIQTNNPPANNTPQVQSQDNGSAEAAGQSGSSGEETSAQDEANTSGDAAPEQNQGEE